MAGEMITRTLELKIDKRLTMLEINKKNRSIIKSLYGGKVFSDCGNVYVKIVASPEECDQLEGEFANAVDVLELKVVEDKLGPVESGITDKAPEKIKFKTRKHLLQNEQVG
jgi:hypothetical protein